MPDYAAYTEEELALDPYFSEWVLEGSAEANGFWQAWLKEHPERAEILARARQLVNAIRIKVEEPSDDTVAALWQRLETQIDIAEIPVRPLQRRQPWLLWAVAASVAVLIALALFLYLPRENTLEVYAEQGNQVEGYLPDSSSYTLNAGSYLEIFSESWESARKLRLEGEAFFQVEKGTPFTVSTARGQVQVLGTEFNVFARAQHFEVKCYEGKVSVALAGIDSVYILTAGQALSRVGMDTPRTSSWEPGQVRDWRTGFFSYQGTPLKTVLEEVERQFDIQVEVEEEMAQRSYHGDFSSHHLDSALFKICWPMNLEYRINQKQVEIFEP